MKKYFLKMLKKIDNLYSKIFFLMINNFIFAKILIQENMKKKIHFKFVGISLIGVLFLVSCSQVSDNLSVIPKEASAVSVINLYSLAQKGKLNEISERKFFQTMKEELQGESKKLSKLVDDIFEDPAITGIDIKADIFGYYIGEEQNKGYGCLSAKLNSGKKFGNFITEILKEFEIDYTIEEGKNYKYIILAQENLAIAWDAEKALVLTSLAYDGGQGLATKIETLMTLKADEQIRCNEAFNNFYKDKKDISFWFSADVLGKSALMVLMQESGIDYANSYLNAYFNFDKGKVSLLVQFSPNEELKRRMNEYSGKTISFNENLLQYLPKTSYAAINVTLDTKAFYETFQKESAFDDIKTAFEEELDMDIKEFFDSFNGSVLFSLFDFTEERLPMMGLVFDINGGQTVEKVIKRARGLETEQANCYTFDLGGEQAAYVAFNEKVCLVTNDKNTANAFQNNGFGNESLDKNPIKTDLTKNTCYGYWNLNLNEYPENVKEMILRGQVFNDKVFNMWNSFVRNFEFRSIDAVSSEFVLNLHDTENSLYSIIKFADIIFAEMTP